MVLLYFYFCTGVVMPKRERLEPHEFIFQILCILRTSAIIGMRAIPRKTFIYRTSQLQKLSRHDCFFFVFPGYFKHDYISVCWQTSFRATLRIFTWIFISHSLFIRINSKSYRAREVEKSSSNSNYRASRKSISFQRHRSQ